jgi:hypothetical protein
MCWRKIQQWLTLSLITLSGVYFNYAWADHTARCTHCGCQASCEKICRLVCEEKKVTITCWGVAHEDVCLPGPSQRGCRHCEEVCEECAANPTQPSAEAKKFVWFDWMPGTARDITTKHKLQKKTITKKVPSHKWVVEQVCASCAEQATRGAQSPAAQLAEHHAP